MVSDFNKWGFLRIGLFRPYLWFLFIWDMDPTIIFWGWDWRLSLASTGLRQIGNVAWCFVGFDHDCFFKNGYWVRWGMVACAQLDWKLKITFLGLLGARDVSHGNVVFILEEHYFLTKARAILHLFITRSRSQFNFSYFSLSYKYPPNTIKFKV